MLLSSSRVFIFSTTDFISSNVEVACGSTVLITQLHDVRKFSAYLDTSDADISIQIEKVRAIISQWPALIYQHQYRLYPKKRWGRWFSLS